MIGALGIYILASLATIAGSVTNIENAIPTFQAAAISLFCTAGLMAMFWLAGTQPKRPDVERIA